MLSIVFCNVWHPCHQKIYFSGHPQQIFKICLLNSENLTNIKQNASDEEYIDEEDKLPKVAAFQPLSSKFKMKEEKRVKVEKTKKKKQTIAEMEAKDFKDQKKAELEAVD